MRKLAVVQTSSKKVMVPIIKIVGDFCNLRCAYCFYNTLDQQTPHVMSEELQERFIREYLELFQGRVQFIWHGGEPLLAGMKFFERSLTFQQKYRKDHEIQNVVQTNATLANDAWAAFFAEHKFKVGISLDGDRISHDRFRTRRNESGSFDAVMRGISHLRAHGIQPGFIQTLTAANAARASEDFTFFANVLKAKSWGTSEYLDVVNINRRMLNETMGNKELTEYLKAFIDLWFEMDDPNIRHREIDNYFAGIVGRCASSCTHSGTCSAYFTVEYDGRVFPCDRLANRSELCYGNLSDTSLLDVLNSERRLKFAEEVNAVHPDCAACEWQKVCHNGCSHHRKGGLSGKYYYCETRKAIFPYLREKINAVMEGGDTNANGNTAAEG